MSTRSGNHGRQMRSRDASFSLTLSLREKEQKLLSDGAIQGAQCSSRKDGSWIPDAEAVARNRCPCNVRLRDGVSKGKDPPKRVHTCVNLDDLPPDL